MSNKYDYLIVGCGLYGATFANQMKKNGKRCLIIDKREHIGGNVYCEQQHGVTVHKYGAHIFHTNDKEIWDFVCAHVDMEPYINSPLVRYKDEQYNLPFNMNTFHGLWGVKKPEEAMAMIEKQRAEYNNVTPPSNLEEQALSLVGRDIYEKLIKGYTEKQWGKKATELPAFIIKRIPVRFTYDNNYFSDKYQG
ncbi:TPA: NAD(P)-binding protein, partial [Aeromonas sobria]|nr:NAD(P)-binding protein [Aeromonas sobria]